MDTLTLGQVETGMEPPTFQFVDNLLYMNHWATAAHCIKRVEERNPQGFLTT